MKRNMKQGVILAAIMTFCGGMMLTSCSEADNALVVTDDKPWTISADDMDPNVRPGDDFFMHCNGGHFTLGENIADLGGVELAFEAYTNRLKRQGFEGEQLRLQQQRFYLAYGHLWQAKYNALYAQEFTQGRNELGTGKNVHSLERERVNGVVMNTDAWYDLFDVKPGDKLYRKPEERVHIW